MPIVNRVDTIFVHVTDLERSISWYSRLLGLDVREGRHEGPIYTLDMGQGRPGITLDNHCFDENYVFTPSNQPLFNLSASDIHEAYRHVTELGAEIVNGIVTYPDLAEFSFQDPAGNIIMVCTCFS
ncbi:VOC family protein [Paenibacillus mucilaginosus]|uniref:VOC family protein n=1 Tax=Paenibacillus mucilaginosus TaxID=61624 RepID=UPI0009DAF2C5|nr:VOC family protein [Paenibacillus mucilaginosus]MCG7215414.1 VOC family protein [Paenibacillus mucilaginosus]WDM30554.1 VOC family protein [Paenibacillus mucilaginosus]